jgi:hypothetical protein
MASLLLQEGIEANSARQNAAYFRRHASRVAVGEAVYAFWSCDGREGLSRVRDLSLGGLFIESPVEQDLGAPVKLDFLADEGQIRANAVVRHVKPGKGAGLKLIAIDERDCQRLAGLIQRVGTSLEAASTAAGQ